MIGHFIALALFQRRSPAHELGELHRRQMLAEIELTEDLMDKAGTAGDDELRVKLREYKAKLECDLGL